MSRGAHWLKPSTPARHNPKTTNHIFITDRVPAKASTQVYYVFVQIGYCIVTVRSRPLTSYTPASLVAKGGAQALGGKVLGLLRFGDDVEIAEELMGGAGVEAVLVLHAGSG